MNSASERRFAYIGIGLFAIAMCIVAFIAKGTGDDGDSIAHYLYSRDAFLYPKYFFNHWAKPLFVFISAPFAQFGWVGVKLMNVASLMASLVLTYQLALRWRLPNAWLAPFFVVAQHRVLSHTLSGLTEPMFAAVLVWCVWLYDRQKYFWATVIASFLPFIRSEGLIVMCVLLVYLMIQRQWKYLPLLALGHVVYAFAGYSKHKSLLWIFNTMSYATLDHVYGVGKWNHFILEMPWVTGAFVYFILIVGLIDGLRRLLLFLQGKDIFVKNELWLAYGMFVAYTIAHTIFWMLGIFASQGLMRVMLCVAPMMGIICLRGTNGITEGVQRFIPKAKTVYLHLLVVALAIKFLDLNLDTQIDFGLHPSQITQTAAAQKYRDKVLKDGYALYSEAMYIDMEFGINPFDDPRHRSFHQIIKREPVPEKSLLVWEPIFAGGMYKVPFEILRDDKRFLLIDSFMHEDFVWGGTTKTFVFETDTNYIRRTKAKEPLYFNNFEYAPYPNHDHSRSRQGTLVIQLEEKLPYAPGMEGTISSYFTKPEHRFKVSFDVYVEDLGQLPSVIFQTMTTTGQGVGWQRFMIDKQVKEVRHWYTVEVFGTAKKTDEERDIFKIYVWNANKASAFIDNFRVDYAD
jgi:hypothetical protein